VYWPKLGPYQERIDSTRRNPRRDRGFGVEKDDIRPSRRQNVDHRPLGVRQVDVPEVAAQPGAADQEEATEGE
jgi:hypothetical protein